MVSNSSEMHVGTQRLQAVGPATVRAWRAPADQGVGSWKDYARSGVDRADGGGSPSVHADGSQVVLPCQRECHRAVGRDGEALPLRVVNRVDLAGDLAQVLRQGIPVGLAHIDDSALARIGERVVA